MKVFCLDFKGIWGIFSFIVHGFKGAGVQGCLWVILTSSRESSDLQECYRLGVNAYVVKPVRFFEFVEAVKHIGMFWILINQTPPDGAWGQ